MNPNFKYKSVPHNFAYCLNEKCKHSTKCLLYLVSKQLTQERTVFSIVNPDCTMPQADSCPFFKADKIYRYALGISRLFEDLPHSKAIAIKQAINANFSKETFYRIQKEKRLITPTEQNIIRQIFIHDIHTDPLFDKYIEQYDW